MQHQTCFVGLIFRPLRETVKGWQWIFSPRTHTCMRLNSRVPISCWLLDTARFCFMFDFSVMDFCITGVVWARERRKSMRLYYVCFCRFSAQWSDETGVVLSWEKKRTDPPKYEGMKGRLPCTHTRTHTQTRGDFDTCSLGFFFFSSPSCIAGQTYMAAIWSCEMIFITVAVKAVGSPQF